MRMKWHIDLGDNTANELPLDGRKSNLNHNTKNGRK